MNVTRYRKFMCLARSGPQLLPGTNQHGTEGRGGVLIYVRIKTIVIGHWGGYTVSSLCSGLVPAHGTDSSHFMEQSVFHILRSPTCFSSTNSWLSWLKGHLFFSCHLWTTVILCKLSLIAEIYFFFLCTISIYKQNCFCLLSCPFGLMSLASVFPLWDLGSWIERAISAQLGF